MTREARAKRVLLIVFDYMGYGDIEPFGSSEINTPNIRRLAEDGRRYTDFYAAAPICVPSRAAMLTGRYPRRLGLEANIYHGEPGLPTSEKTLARYFRDAGYRTALFGKWHLGYDAADGPNAHGFEEFLGFHEWNIDYYSHRTRTGDPALYRGTKLVDIEGYTTDIFTDAAVEFVTRAGEVPYFLYVSYNAALPPYSPPKCQVDKAARDAWVDGSRADYVKVVEHLDYSVGRLLAALADVGHVDDSVILLTYDHGGAEMATKAGFFHGFGTLWEGGIRVPMILHWPRGVSPGEVVQEPAILMDVTPTLLSTAGLFPEQPIDGVDLLAGARNGSRTLYWRIDLPTIREDWRARAQRAVRRGKWKYLWDGGFEFLYDMIADPGERDNLVFCEPELVDEFRGLSEGAW